MALPPGHKLGPYEIVASIGAGGMGEVYKAIDTRLGRTVAIKTLNGEHGEHFQQEARAVAALNHPHICVLYDVGPGYLVMEYIDGQPLHGPLPLPEVVRVATQVAGALDVAQIIDDDPLCQMWYYTLAITLTALRREDEAIGALRRAVELDPQFWIGWMLQSLLYALHERHAESLHCAEKAIASAPWAPIANGVMAAALANTDRAPEAERMLNALRGNASVGPFGMAYYFLARGDMERAVEWAGKAAEQRIASLVTILIRPFEPRMRTAPGWPGLLKKLNLTPAV